MKFSLFYLDKAYAQARISICVSPL